MLPAPPFDHGHAVEEGLALTNPCTIKGAGTEPKPETEIPSVAEVHKLADCLDERLRCMVLLAAFMGLRKGELLGLRCGDVDLDAKVLTARCSSLARSSSSLSKSKVSADTGLIMPAP